MITIPELKYYLKDFDQNKTQPQIAERNIFLSSAINKAKEKLNTLTGRQLKYSTYTELIKKNIFSRDIYLIQRPIYEIDSIQYYESDDYTDLIKSPDTILDKTEIFNYGILIRNGYSVKNKDLKIVYKAGYKFSVLSGTLSGTIGTNTITGTGTAFNTELQAGDQIVINAEILEVDTITSATVLNTTSNLSRTYTGEPGTLNTYPEDIRQACLEIAAITFLNSPIGDNRIGKSSANINLGASVGDSYKDLDFSHIKNKYRTWTL